MTDINPENTVTMPRSLAAENGAKAALMGEFFSEIAQLCPDCEGDGRYKSGEQCYTCKGSGSVGVKIPVSWTTIKAIYAKAVEVCGRE